MDGQRREVGLLEGFVPVGVTAPVVGAQHRAIGEVTAGSSGARPPIPRFEDVDDDLGEWDGSDSGSGLGRPDHDVAFDFRCRPSDVKTSGAEVDVP